jgi:hypothetical protein
VVNQFRTVSLNSVQTIACLYPAVMDGRWHGELHWLAGTSSRNVGKQGNTFKLTDGNFISCQNVGMHKPTKWLIVRI